MKSKKTKKAKIATKQAVTKKEEQATKQGVSAKQEVAELKQVLQRLQAEFENFKRRTETEKSLMMDYGRLQVLQELMQVLDGARLSERCFPKELKKNTWAEGVIQVYKMMRTRLAAIGFKQMEDVVGKDFDHNFHEALLQGEGDKSGVILEEIEPGYMLGDKVIRAAKVKVTK